MFSYTEPHLLSGLPKNTPILLALSGGADSRALFHLLLSYGVPLAVAHVDHGIRGEASHRDRTFCETLAREANVPFYVLETDIPVIAAKNHLGLEEQARMERYCFFEQIMKEHNIPILATAHNATDNAETMLFRMARGTGLSGLCGIAATRPFGCGVVIRPLLQTTKEEILAYCKQNRLHYVTDETNTDIGYARNRIRHKILPELTALNRQAIRHISELSRTLSQDEDFLTSNAKSILSKEQEDTRDENQSISLATLGSLPPTMATRVLGLLFGEPPISSKNREELMILAARAVPHSSLHLSNGRRAVIENQRLVATAEKNPPLNVLAPTPVDLGVTPLFDKKMLLILDSEINPHEKWFYAKNIYKNATTININFDRIKDGLFVRTRTEGDKILFHGVHKKIRKLQNELGLSPRLRSSLPLLCDKDGILWAPLVAVRDGESENCSLRVTLFYNSI